jgi:hypothetical protein
MSDELEDFVRKNRGGFDNQEPAPKVWKRIESALFPEQRVTLWNSLTLWRAAAVVFMGVSIYLFASQNIRSDSQNIALNDFEDVEDFYVAQISQKTEMIHELYEAEGLNGFTQDFRQLEAMYAVLKEEIRTRPSQKVKDALVLNLLVRIDLLNQQLHKLQQRDNIHEGSAEKTVDNPRSI